MANVKYKHTKLFYIFLFFVFAFICLYSPFVYLFNFQYDYGSYHLAVFILVTVNIATLLFLSLAELASLSFDRTASKNTLYATIFVFHTYITSNDFIFFLEFVGVTIPQGVIVTLHIFSHLFMLASLMFFLRFYEEDFKLKIMWKVIFVYVGIAIIANILFNIFNIFYGLVALSVLECLSLSILLISCKPLLKDKYNNYPRIVSLLIVFTIFISSVFDLLYKQDRTFLGINSMFYILVFTAYLTIYIDFMIKKTLSSYSYEDEKNKEMESKSHVMMVSCFHCFGCTYDGKQVDFPSKKAKELFALLVILRGKPLSIEKAITYLWPDKDVEKSKILYRNAVMKLRQTFKEIDCPYLSFKRGEIHLDITNIICDYYDAEDGKKSFTDAPLLPEYEWSLEFENILK